ncbi:nucleobase-ascorbate transporter 11 [Canna indica]|uniref:Nucleobase-ascorbate transporter 11 n=1 Tax=Canna indica TaxID=4628 RepID=A0AAQ3KE89_9LILI|nr:nucleobase-ascorbate transporter 11 [Canna indica]
MDGSRSTSEGLAGRHHKPGPRPPRIEPFLPNRDHNPRELKSWARRTGFSPSFSGETASVVSDRDAVVEHNPPAAARLDLEKGINRRGNGSSKKTEIETVPCRGRTIADSFGIEIDPVAARAEKEKSKVGIEPTGAGLKDERGNAGHEPLLRAKRDVLEVNGNRNGTAPVSLEKADLDLRKESEKDERGVEIGFISDDQEPDVPSRFRSGVTENPGFAPLFFYGIQHYLSLAGSLVFIPLIMVPAMGGTDEETATVISTLLLVSGVTTIMHSYFGSRLPLVQGSSFIYLAPALVIINSEEFRNLSVNKFKHIMRELQGAIIVGSIFQTILGYSGIMSLLLRLINPVVVAPTVAAVGLAYFSYGFPQAGNCVQISIPLILLVLFFTLYLQKLSLLGNRLFLIYAVPLSVIIVWAYSFFLTAGGAYNYKDCSSNVPSSNILSDGCREHATIMKHCRTDVSNAWRTAAWVRVPYPFQWGPPSFHFKTSFIMVIVSLVASVESVGSYHATSLLIDLKPPTPGIVSRAIGMEGLASILAGIWGTGTGSTTLTENIHTLDATRVASRKALQLGALLLILFSFVGKIGALLASIPLALAASVLCFTWALTVAIGISTLQYTQTASSRNIIIVGFTLFLSLSIPAYFQHYEPNSSLILPSYLVPYGAASNGPIRTSSQGLNFALNALLSLNMVVAFLVAFILDNTVPGSKQERGVYIWSDKSTLDLDPSAIEPYSLPAKVRPFVSWAKWVGS